VTVTGWRAAGPVLLLAALITAGCGQPIPINGDAYPLRLAADTATAPLAESLLNAYETRQPHAILTLAHGNRDTALAALASGEVDAALLLHPPDGRELFSTPVGFEMLVIVAHPGVTVDDLARGDLRAIFSGQVRNWSALDGPDVGVQVVSRERGSSMRLAFEALIMEQAPLTPSARLAVDEGHVLELVGATPGAVGYVAHNALDERSLSLSVLALGVEAAFPTLSAARDKAYRLVTPVVFVSLEEPEDNVRAFLEWVLDDEGQAVVRRHVLGLSD
jgi:phosphate transport system substrate-binding protein